MALTSCDACLQKRVSTDSNAAVREFLDFGSSTDIDDNFGLSDFSNESSFL